MKNLLWLQALVLGLFIVSCNSFGGNPGNEADLKKLEGTWVRVESNAPAFDYMKVRVSGNTGTVTDKANSDFTVGDIKWDAISSDGKDVFAYRELGNDGNYYDATITLISENELRIAVANSGSGNDQKWLLDDGTIVPVGGIALDCSISEDRVLTNTAAPVDYIVSCVVDITAKLTIEPGVVIAFAEGAGFGVYDGGALNAVGTDTEPITFKGSSSQSGWWRGIHIETSTVSNRLENVNIQDAGSNYVYCCNEPASLFLKGAKITLDHLNMSNGEGIGIYADNATQLPDYSNVSITTHKETPLYVGILVTGYLDGNASDYSGNEKDFVRIMRTTVSDPITMPANNVPYLLDNEVFDITQGLTIAAGAELVMKENAGLGVYDDGFFKVEGSSSKPVIIRGEQAVAGYWRGIHIETNSLNNQISYAEISEAGSNYVYCCRDAATIFLKAGKLAMDHTTLSNGAGYGLEVLDVASLRAFDSNTITTHDEFPVFIAAERAGELDGMNSDFTGNTADFIGIFDSSVDDPTTWARTNVPYRIEGNKVIDITAALTIEAGAEIVFEQEAGMGVYDSGSLKAVGTASNGISFRGLDNIKGYWRGIHTETTSSNNELGFVSIHNAGSNYVYCCNDPAALYVKSGTMNLHDSEISNNAGCGVFVKSGANLTESGNTITDNTVGDICQ